MITSPGEETAGLYEPRHDKTCLREFPTRPDTNRPAQPQKFEISVIESTDIILSKQRTTKALIRLRGCCSHMTLDTFSHGPAHMYLMHLYVYLACVAFLHFLFLSVSGLAANCDRGTPWIFHLTCFCIIT